MCRQGCALIAGGRGIETLDLGLTCQLVEQVSCQLLARQCAGRQDYCSWREGGVTLDSGPGTSLQDERSDLGPEKDHFPALCELSLDKTMFVGGFVGW